MMFGDLVYVQAGFLLGVPVPKSGIDYAGGFIQNFIQNLLGGWFWLILVVGIIAFALFSRGN